ncbi:MAG: hypothetical protein MJY95_08330 [Bacteroidaceae bacterium]|nr:hypothetical protein [Bacteroidaceae bacterium]
MNLYERAVLTFGRMNQTIVAIEELSELQKELTKHLRGIGRNECLAEEMADVQIVMEQLLLIFDNGKEVQEEKNRKLKRLEERIEREENW